MKKGTDLSLLILAFAAVTGALKFLFFPGSEILSIVLFVVFCATAFLAGSLNVKPWAQAVLVVMVLLIGIPMIGMRNTFFLDVAINIGIYAALALGLNIVVGFAGLLDLGFIAFYAIGAYLWGIFGSPQANNFIAGNHFPLTGNWFFLFVILAVIAASVFGFLLGLPVLKLKGDYLALVTLGFGEVIRVLANTLDKPTNFTNGPQGITPIQQPLTEVAAALARPGLEAFKWQLLIIYVIVLVIIGVAIFLTNRLDNSKIGRAWVAIREDEVAAQAMGVPIVATKLIAFATGASFSGAMGAVFAAKQTFISPETFNMDASVGILAMVVLGGFGSIRGALLGAFIVSVLNFLMLPALSSWFNDLRSSGVLNLPTQFEVSKYQRFIFGIILIVMMIYRPQGLIPSARRKLEVGENS